MSRHRKGVGTRKPASASLAWADDLARCGLVHHDLSDRAARLALAISRRHNFDGAILVCSDEDLAHWMGRGLTTAKAAKAELVGKGYLTNERRGRRILVGDREDTQSSRFRLTRPECPDCDGEADPAAVGTPTAASPSQRSPQRSPQRSGTRPLKSQVSGDGERGGADTADTHDRPSLRSGLEALAGRNGDGLTAAAAASSPPLRQQHPSARRDASPADVPPLGHATATPSDTAAADTAGRTDTDTVGKSLTRPQTARAVDGPDADCLPDFDSGEWICPDDSTWTLDAAGGWVRVDDREEATA